MDLKFTNEKKKHISDVMNCRGSNQISSNHIRHSDSLNALILSGLFHFSTHSRGDKICTNGQCVSESIMYG